MTNIDAANKLRAVAEAWQAEATPDMMEVYESDAEQLRDVAQHIEQGAMAQAGDLAIKLDTILREQIPQDVWDMITR